MTPYRERRMKAHYNENGEKPATTHSHHLRGLMTATKPPKPEAKAKDK